MNKNIAKNLYLSDNYKCHNELGEYLYQNIDSKQKKKLITQILNLLVESFQLVTPEIVSLNKVILEDSLWEQASKNFNELRSLSLEEQRNNGWPTLNGYIYQLLENIAKIIHNESGQEPKYDYKAAYSIISNMNNISKMLKLEQQRDFSQKFLDIILDYIDSPTAQSL